MKTGSLTWFAIACLLWLIADTGAAGYHAEIADSYHRAYTWAGNVCFAIWFLPVFTGRKP